MNSASLPRGMSTGADWPGHEDLLESLGEPGHRDLVGQTEPAHDLLGDAELALAAVDEQQLRRVAELRRARSGLGRPGRPLDARYAVSRRVSTSSIAA